MATDPTPNKKRKTMKSKDGLSTPTGGLSSAQEIKSSRKLKGPITPTADIPVTTPIEPGTGDSSLEQFDTREEFAGNMSWLLKRINDTEQIIKTAPSMSTEANQALAARADLLYTFVKNQIAATKKFGSYGVGPDGKLGAVKTVPKNMTDLLSALADPKTRQQASFVAAPLAAQINMAGGQEQQKNPKFYQLNADPKFIAQAVKIGGGTPAVVASSKGQVKTGVTGTPGAGGGGVAGGTGVGGAGGKLVSPKTKKLVDWESKFREMFPRETWMLDIDRTKYADVFALFQKSITQEVYKTPEGIARFKAQLEGTSFVKELASTDMVRQVKAVVGDLGFDSAPLSSFLTKAMNMGWKDETLKAEVYKEAFRKDDSGAYVNPTAITRAKASNDYLSISKIGKDYFNSVSDDTIQNVLTGGMTQEDVQRQQRELAKTKYGHLSNLIDQGLSLADVSSSFKQQAASMLERDPNSIDMGQADFEQAFNFGEEGKKRVMTTGEWEIKLRSDPRYNWDKTTNAKQEARALANSIATAFGRVI